MLNTEFYAADAAEFIQRMDTKPDVVILDPPRSGMTLPFMHKLAQLSPDRIVYISCNPSTLAKNLKVLKQRYHVVTVIPYDLFPQTPLVESITVLELG